MDSNQTPEKTIIGRVESIDLPEFGIVGIGAKVDTGAFRSAIHSNHFFEEMTDSGPVLVFTLLDSRHPSFNKRYQVKDFSKIRIRSSNGEAQYRYKITTDVILNGKLIRADFTLANRMTMVYPVLIGRQALNGHFVVDVSVNKKNKK